MITDHVTTMLFEAACFDGTNIRKSGKRIGLRTDASAKFEKGLDPNLAMEAMNRACQLVEELGVGEVVGGAVDIYPVKREDVKIPFEPDKYNKLLGTDIPAGDMIGYFKKLIWDMTKQRMRFLFRPGDRICFVTQIWQRK